MTARRRHPDDGADDAPLDETAQRLLNLLFIFNAAERPLTTDEIVSDADLGYGSPNRASDLRKFRRDREKLAERGVFIAEVRATDAAETEQSSWAIDRARTFAGGGIVREGDVHLLVEAIDAYLAGPAHPLAPPLNAVRIRAREELARLAGELPPEDPQRVAAPTASRRNRARQNGTADALWTAFSLRRTVPLTYRNARGASSQRTVAVYGIFAHGAAGYVVGLDSATQAVRTFRIDRIERLGVLGDSYEVPADFDVRPYLFLPFDLGEDEPVAATFSLPAERTCAELAALTYGRGTSERADDGSWRWHIAVRDLDAAAAFALEHARDGMRPVAPATLVDVWRDTIAKAVSAHA